MPVFFRMGKQRYCQGLPLLASMTVVPGDMNELPEGIALTPLEEGPTSRLSYAPSGVIFNDGGPTAVFELDTNVIPDGGYTLVALDGSAVSSPVMILTKEAHDQLLLEENSEDFDGEVIPSSCVYRFVECIVCEYWTRVESVAPLLRDRVMHSGFHPSLFVTGQVEGEDRQISVAKLRYGGEAILSDLSYLASVPLGDAFRPDQSTLDLRIDQKGNLLLHARTQVGVMRPDQLLDALRSYSDLRQLERFHPAIFESQIGLSGVNTFELSLTVAAESDKGTRGEGQADPYVSAGGSVVREPAYATG
jgi:hypothetical protein